MRAAASIFTTKKERTDGEWTFSIRNMLLYEVHMNAAMVHACIYAHPQLIFHMDVPVPIQLCSRDVSIGTKVHSYSTISSSSTLTAAVSGAILWNSEI